MGDDQRLSTDRVVVELILMAGFYVMLARLTETLEVESEAPFGASLVQSIEARVKGKK